MKSLPLLEGDSKQINTEHQIAIKGMKHGNFIKSDWVVTKEARKASLRTWRLSCDLREKKRWTTWGTFKAEETISAKAMRHIWGMSNRPMFPKSIEPKGRRYKKRWGKGSSSHKGPCGLRWAENKEGVVCSAVSQNGPWGCCKGVSGSSVWEASHSTWSCLGWQTRWRKKQICLYFGSEPCRTCWQAMDSSNPGLPLGFGIEGLNGHCVTSLASVDPQSRALSPTALPVF